MTEKKGQLSIHSENILPIIKKWLYSDMDIFVRELVSNASDAISKLKRLDSMGDYNLPNDEQFFIKLRLDKENKTISIEDNGVGMTSDEVERYINQIAFSGATEFIDKYKDKNDEGDGIIGHFGLGFYSAFMVADKVTINTRSYQPGAEAALWSCDGGIEFELSTGSREARGTLITLHIGKDGEEFLEDYRLRTILKKYCGFIPVDIYFENAAAKDNDTEPEPINDKTPLWLQRADKLTEQDYKRFYHQAFMDFNEPLFWIHLNMDYPFRLKGILYFPKARHNMELQEGQVKLFCNQVFVADNIREVIPEFLLLLKGVMDCPDLPLNVSRSFLQNDSYVQKMASYIVRKVADKLSSLLNTDRAAYEGYWDDIQLFIKYGCIKDKDFFDKSKDALLLKLTDGSYVTFAEYKERNYDKTDQRIIYSTDNAQHGYVSLFNKAGVDVVDFSNRIDMAFLGSVEVTGDMGFVRVDADAIGQKETEEDYSRLVYLFKEHLEEGALDNIKDVEVSSLVNEDIPAMLFVSEEQRRMGEMGSLYGLGASMPVEQKLVLNSENKLVRALGNDMDKETRQLLTSHIMDMAYLSQGGLDKERMGGFIARNTEILLRILPSL